jgi:hypothetical protein
MNGLQFVIYNTCGVEKTVSSVIVRVKKRRWQQYRARRTHRIFFFATSLSAFAQNVENSMQIR